MVGVLVREEDGRKIFRSAANTGKTLADLARGKARIYQDARFTGLQVGAIAGGTAAENGKSNGHRKKLVAARRAGKFI